MAGIPAVTVRAALGANPTQGAGWWTWTDVTKYVRAKNRIAIKVGRLDEYSVVQPSSCELDVDNADGRWVARNPTGPWYGLIRRNTPIQVLIGDNLVRASDTFTRTVVDGWGAADVGGTYSLAGAGGSVTVADFDVTGAAATIAVPVAAAFRFGFLPGISEVDQECYVEFTCATPTGGNLEPACLLLRGVGVSEYYNCRVHVTTASAVQVQIDHASVSTLVAATTVSGLAHTPATVFKVRAQAYGPTVRIRVWTGAVEPVVWHAEATDLQPIGAAGWAGIRVGRATGNTNAGVSATLDNFSVQARPVRFSGFVNELPVSWDPSGRDSTVGIVASGSLRRLGQGTAPLRSALYRALTSMDWAAPVGYWPMEDASGSTLLASATGGLPATFTDISLGGFSGNAGSAPLPTLGAGAVVVGDIPAFTPTSWAVRHVLNFTAFPGINVFPLGWFSGGTLTTWGVILTPTGLTLHARDAAGTEVLGAASIAFATLLNTPIGIEVSASQSGADIAWSLKALWAGVTLTVSGTAAGQTLGAPYRWQIRESAGLVGGSVGHVAFYDTTADTAPPISSSLYGWAGTNVASRIGGLCTDAGIPIAIVDGTPTTLLGPQSRSGILALIREAEAADLGILSEDGFGLRYLSRWERYNRAVELALDHRLGQVADLRPTDDDQVSRNDVTVTRTGGSTYHVADLVHQALYDVYYDSPTINVYADADLPFQAWWRLHVGTVDDLRHPVLGLNLRARPELVTAWRTARIGSRVTIANPPRELGTDTIDVHLQGWTETIDDGAGIWYVTANTSSALSWTVGELDDSDVGRLDATATLSAAATSTASTLSAVSVGSLFELTAPPFPAVLAGEQVTVTAVGSTIRDTFTRSASSGWGTADTGHVWTVGAGTAALFSVTGSVGQIAVTALNTEHHIGVDLGYAAYQRVRTYQTLGVTPTGAGINWGVMLRRVDASNFYWIDVQVGTDSSLTLRVISKIAGANVQLATAPSATAHSTSVARILVAEIDDADVIRAKVYADGGADEPPWELTCQASTTDLQTGTGVGAIARLMTGNTNAAPVNFAFDNFAVLNPQLLTVTRSANSVVKAQTAGTAIHVKNALVLAL